MAKSTYNGLITIPGAASDSIEDGSTIGGDIVANFKKLADCSAVKRCSACSSCYHRLPQDGVYFLETWGGEVGYSSSLYGVYEIIYTSTGGIMTTKIYGTDATVSIWELDGTLYVSYTGGSLYTRITPIYNS
ncbi:MAG: hypothetical protein Q4D98_03505 [Planctomycetia bacterium]|nr:hypothetical protein [Planctomycetia bacterium]